MEISCAGMSHENNSDILRNKIGVLGGLNYISVENINKTNKSRIENFDKFIELAYPYIKLNKETKKSGIDSLIEQYKQMFPDQT